MKLSFAPSRLAIGVVMVVGVAACGSSASTSQASATPLNLCTPKAVGDVCIDTAFTFEPASLSVASGTAVTFTNDSTATHTATTDGNPSNPAKFNSGDLAVGQSYTIKLTAVGTYTYMCSIHNYMKGTITVH